MGCGQILESLFQTGSRFYLYSHIYILQVSTSSSAGFGAAMALASVVFEEYDEDYSIKCLDAAKMAYKYVKNNTAYNPSLPSGFSAGDYALAEDGLSLLFRYCIMVCD